MRTRTILALSLLAAGFVVVFRPRPRSRPLPDRAVRSDGPRGREAPIESPEPGLEDRDDLKAIRGIGPKLEQILNDHGIRTFRQIARWREADIEEVAVLLEEKGWFPGRIERDDWIAGARLEHGRKYGQEP